MRPKFKIMAKKKTNTIEYTFKNGDNISEVARKITGYAYLLFRLLEFNGLSMGDVKVGTVLKWR